MNQMRRAASASRFLHKLAAGRRNGSAGTSRRQQHQLAGMLLRDEILLRLDDRAERVGAGDARPDLAALGIADEIGEDLVALGRAAEEGQVLEVELAQIELDDRAGDGA